MHFNMILPATKGVIVIVIEFWHVSLAELALHLILSYFPEGRTAPLSWQLSEVITCFSSVLLLVKTSGCSSVV